MGDLLQLIHIDVEQLRCLCAPGRYGLLRSFRLAVDYTPHWIMIETQISQSILAPFCFLAK
jgi:hypothetical protein